MSEKSQEWYDRYGKESFTTMLALLGVIPTDVE